MFRKLLKIDRKPTHLLTGVTIEIIQTRQMYSHKIMNELDQRQL